MFNELLPREWDKMHHAYLISGAEPESVWGELANLGFKRQGNPDARHEEFETLGIEESRSLSEWALLKPIAGERKVLVATANSFTTEAQNALLKLFEEPPQGTYFFLHLPNVGSILPTLLSRVRVVRVGSDEVNKKYGPFLAGSVAERWKIISPIIKAKDKDRAKALIKFLESKIAEEKDYGLKMDRADKIIRADRYLQGRGSSLKMILEYLAVSL